MDDDRARYLALKVAAKIYEVAITHTKLLTSRDEPPEQEVVHIAKRLESYIKTGKIGAPQGPGYQEKTSGYLR